MTCILFYVLWLFKVDALTIFLQIFGYVGDQNLTNNLYWIFHKHVSWCCERPFRHPRSGVPSIFFSLFFQYCLAYSNFIKLFQIYEELTFLCSPSVSMEEGKHIASSRACIMPWFICINNCSFWRLLCEWFQKSFQSQGSFWIPPLFSFTKSQFWDQLSHITSLFDAGFWW